MLELEQSLERILAAMPAAAAETAHLHDAAGRIAAAAVISPIDLPSFDNSAMDGYAVRTSDVASASRERPARLVLSGRVAAGAGFSGMLGPGECVRVFTGAVVPDGSDAVVMQEDTLSDPGFPKAVDVIEAVTVGENIRVRGTDVRRGSAIVKPGHRLRIGDLCLLAATGIANVQVGTRPKVSILPTGSELRKPGEILGPGTIYESNSVGLDQLIRRAGGLSGICEPVPDDPEATLHALTREFAVSDIVVTCGGVSVGEHDLVKGAFERLGGRLDFWRVAMKPGKPFAFGNLRGKFLFGLPGNPVSAFVTFLLLVRPALLRWQGASDVALPSRDAVVAEALENRGGRRHFMRVKAGVDGIRAAGEQASHMISSLAEAEGLVDVPAGSVIQRGATVRVLQWE